MDFSAAGRAQASSHPTLTSYTPTSLPAAACGSATRRRPSAGIAAGGAGSSAWSTAPTTCPTSTKEVLLATSGSTSRCGTATPTAPTARPAIRGAVLCIRRRGAHARRVGARALPRGRAPRRDGRRAAAHAQTRVGRGVGDRRRKSYGRSSIRLDTCPACCTGTSKRGRRCPFPPASPSPPPSRGSRAPRPSAPRTRWRRSVFGSRRAPTESRKRWMDCARRSSRGAARARTRGRLARGARP